MKDVISHSLVDLLKNEKYFLTGFSWTEVRLVCASYPRRHFLASSYPWTALASNSIEMMIKMVRIMIRMMINDHDGEDHDRDDNYDGDDIMMIIIRT